MRFAIAGVGLMAMVASGASSVAAEESDLTAEPRRVIEETANQIISILARKEQTAELRIHEIEKIAYEVFDFTTMSKLVLARKWRKLSKDQKGEFVREFKRSLSRTYGTRLDRYDQEEVEIIGTQIEPRDDVSVKTKIVGGQYGGAELSYRLRKRSDRWRIIDVVIEGVSLVSNYRSQFAEILNSGTIDDLLDKLRDKNFKIDDGVKES
jgi:phospholipid transport system substrate-binding protein